MGLVLKEDSGIVEVERYLAVETTQGSLQLSRAGFLAGMYRRLKYQLCKLRLYRTQSYKKSHFMLPLFLPITPYL